MDHLEAAKKEAIKLLLRLPADDPDAEMSITECDYDIWLGMGWLVGRGWVAYRGDDCYCFLSDSARETAKGWLEI